MKITIFGLAGTGKSSVGKELALSLNYEYISSGNIFRAMGLEKGLTVYELNTLAKENPDFDSELDNRTLEYSKKHTNFVYESWLAWYFIPDSFKIKLKCDFETRIQRIAKRDVADLEDVRIKTIQRESDHVERYKRYYNIPDMDDESRFDMVVDTTHILPNEIVEMILLEIKKRMAN